MSGIRTTVRLLALATTMALASCVTAPSNLSAPASRGSVGPAERLARLDPLPFFHEVVDVLAHANEGAGTSCSLYALYDYALQRSGRHFDSREFVRFRRWAIANNMFFPAAADRTVDFDALERRLPEFFGASVAQSLRFEMVVPRDAWTVVAAAALEGGHAVLAMTAEHPDRGSTYTQADHVISLVEPVRASDGHVEAFLVRDPDSYRFWESLHRVTVDELALRLAQPKVLFDGNLAAIAVSSEVTYEIGAQHVAVSSNSTN
ncbi:hypothetical protein [Scleromatobacter humisilvae]|uniref:Peptidase C39-like domain-containing protein n=1 Tax=Scleromatobacter humisilvae TaxID=2897159 RepID=A0A9X2C176_9BURK|nr:hypothetical protein [Scleromatobacter humisilvae]MCK9687271.1 hypothetical protein [Scleromatobacter humisilvae]